jgi:hypothetical protein
MNQVTEEFAGILSTRAEALTFINRKELQLESDLTQSLFLIPHSHHYEFSILIFPL